VFKDRRLLFLLPVVLALLMLLGFARGRGGSTSPSAPLGAGAPVATVPDAGTPDPGLSGTAVATDEDDAGGQPRHPQIGFRTSERLREHFRKHGREFHVKSADAYLRLAQLLRERPKGGDVLEFVRNDAVTCKFDRATGSFIAYDSDGTIRTFFRPTEGEAYFERQKYRAHESP
jgi:hypothetical protein